MVTHEGGILTGDSGQRREIRPHGNKNIFMLNSAEHEIFPVYINIYKQEK